MKYGYGWVLKFLLAAILLGVGIYLQFAPDVVFTITGLIIVLFSLLRVVPLLKSLNKETLRTINLIEIIFDTILGSLLIYVAMSGKLDESNPGAWDLVYRYSLAFFFYARGLVYLSSVTFFEEKSEVPKFFIHIGALTVGTYVATSSDFSPAIVALFLLVIALIGGFYLGYDGYNGYKVYRKFQLELNQGKEKGISKEKELEKKKDVILDEQKEERPYVN